MDLHYLSFEPPAALHGKLRATFYVRGRLPSPTDMVFPNGMTSLVFTVGPSHRLGKDPDPDRNPLFSEGWLTGLQTTPVFNTPAGTDGEARDGAVDAMGLLFEPLGLHALFGIDMGALADRTIDPRSVLPADFLAVVEAALERPDVAPIHTALQHALLALPRVDVPAWMIALHDVIGSSRGEIRLDLAYAAAGITPQQAVVAFKRAVGLTPEALCRLHRMQALLEVVHMGGVVDWRGLALQFGFPDPVDFAAAFTAFTGSAPEDYLAALQAHALALSAAEPELVPAAHDAVASVH